MFKQLVVIALALFAAASAFAADVNRATQAELESIKGIGPALSTRILDARKKGDFKDWSDFSARVSGIAAKTATKFSSAGLTVNGAAFDGSAVAKSPNAKGAGKTGKAAKAAASEGGSTAKRAKPM
jgi:competence protein ComEA